MIFNGDGLCSLWGTDSVLKYYKDERLLQRVEVCWHGKSDNCRMILGSIVRVSWSLPLISCCTCFVSTCVISASKIYCINWKMYSKKKKGGGDTERPNVVVVWLTLLLCIREAPGSYLGPKTGHREWVFRGFPRSIRANSGIVPEIRPRLFHSKSFPGHLPPFNSTLYSLSYRKSVIKQTANTHK
jgi:hypothetical protein